MVTNPTNKDKKVPARYRLSFLAFHYNKFKSQTESQCDYTTFTILPSHLPYYVSKPSPQSWDTYIRGVCLSPELKLEALSQKTEANRFHAVEHSSETIPGLKQELIIVKSDWEKKAQKAKMEDQKIEKQLKAELNITFTEWKSLPNPKSKVGSKVSRKIETHLPMPSFIDLLVKEITVMRDHLRRCYTQFSAFKHASKEAVTCSTVATLLQCRWTGQKTRN